MKIVLVYNPRSGSSLTDRQLRRACKKADITLEKLIPMQSGYEETLAPYINRGAHIAAIGGDGTLNAVAGLLVNTNAVFVPFSGGTFNHFAKDVGVEPNITRAMMGLKSAKPKRIDVGVVNGQIFLNNSSLGLYPTSLKIRQEIESKRIGKWSALTMATVRTLFRFGTYHVTINKKEFHTPFIFVGNNKHSLDGFGGMKRTAVNEGVLNIFIAKTRSRVTLFKILLWAVAGKAHVLNEFDSFSVKEVTIEMKKHKTHVSYDGEVKRMKSPIHYEIKPRSLKLLVGSSFRNA